MNTESENRKYFHKSNAPLVSKKLVSCIKDVRISLENIYYEIFNFGDLILINCKLYFLLFNH